MLRSDYRYAGSELAAFAKARNWKATLRDQITPFLGQRVAEVGAGIGSMTAMFANCLCESWFALEPDSNLASQIKPSERTRVFVGTLADLSPLQTFDTILYIDVLEHIQDDAAELKRAMEHLAPQGHMIVLVPAHNFLFTPFDEAIGHCRRYDRRTLLAAAPPSLTLRRLRYLDSVGFFASLANKVLLQQAAPTESQVLFWDRMMVPVSRITDPLFGFQFGKSVLGIWEKRN